MHLLARMLAFSGLALILSGYSMTGSADTQDQLAKECQVRWWKRQRTSEYGGYYRGRIATSSNVLVHIEVRDDRRRLLAHAVAIPDSDGFFVAHLVTARKITKGKRVRIRCHPREDLLVLLNTAQRGLLVDRERFLRHRVKSSKALGEPGSYRQLPVGQKKKVWPRQH